MAKRAFDDQMGTNVQKAMPFGSPPYQGLQNRELFSKKVSFIFLALFGSTGCFLRFSCCWPYFAAGILFDGSGRTRKAKSNLGSTENPILKDWLIYGIYGHIHSKRAILSNAVWGVSRVICG